MASIKTRARFGALGAALVLAACGSAPLDETAKFSPEKLYAEAREEAAAGNNARAITLLERLEGRAAGTLLGQQAQLDRAHLLYRTNERAEALVVLERFIKLNPSSPGIDYALYLQGLANFNDDLGIFGTLAEIDLSERDQQASRDAYQSFRQLAEQFPQSRYAEDARLRMNYIVNSLAGYEVHVARYYLRRGAYLAAANRAQAALKEFQTSPAAEEALQILVQSYDRLGLADLRDDAQRVLDKSFPGSTRNGRSAAAAPGQQPAAKPWWRFW